MSVKTTSRRAGDARSRVERRVGHPAWPAAVVVEQLRTEEVHVCARGVGECSRVGGPVHVDDVGPARRSTVSGDRAFESMGRTPSPA